MHATPLDKPRREHRPAPRLLAPRDTRRAKDSIAHLGSLHAHELAIAHEAAARYRELAENLSDLGHHEVAAFLFQMGTFQSERALRCMKESVGRDLPVVDPGQYAWLDCGRPVREARAFVHRMLNPRLALAVALAAEQRAKAFFESVRCETRNAAVRQLASDLAHEQEAPVHRLKETLASLPAAYLPTEESPGNPLISQER